MRHTSLVLIALVSAVSLHAAPLNETGMIATPSGGDPDLSLQKMVRCIPNALLSAESAADSLVRNWYLNDTYFLPDLLTDVSIWAIKNAASSVMPVLGSSIADFLLRPISDMQTSPVSAVLHLLSPKQMTDELAALYNIASTALRNATDFSCLSGSEQPISGEALSARLTALENKCAALLGGYGEDLLGELTSSVDILGLFGNGNRQRN